MQSLSGKVRAKIFQTRSFCAWCWAGCNEMGVFDLLVGLANDHGIMRDHSPEEQALIRIQQDWAEARVKGDSSYTRRLEVDDCTIVWPDGRVANKRADLQTMTGDIVFNEFKIHDLQVRVHGET